MPPDNISVIPANKQNDESLSDFLTGTGTTAHSTLDTDHLTSHSKAVLVDTPASVGS